MSGNPPAKDAGLKTVALGLRLIWAGWILSPIVTTGLAVASRLVAKAGNESLLHLIAQTHGWCVLAGGLACSTGTQLCAAAPRAVAGKIYGAIACYLLSITPEMLGHLDVHVVIVEMFQPFAGLAGIVGGILFLLFLHDLADHLGESELSGRAAGILSNLIMAVAGFIVTMFVACMPLISLPAMFALGIYLMVTMVQYLGVLNDMRTALLAPPKPAGGGFKSQWTLPAAAKPPGGDKPIDPDDLELPP